MFSITSNDFFLLLNMFVGESLFKNIETRGAFEFYNENPFLMIFGTGNGLLFESCIIEFCIFELSI